MRLKACAPARLRKQPETFCCTLIMRKSRSARLLSKSTRRSSRKQKTAFWWVRRLREQISGGTLWASPLFPSRGRGPGSEAIPFIQQAQKRPFPGDDFQWMQPALSFGSCLFCRCLHVQEQLCEIGGPDGVLFFGQKD